MKRVDQFGNEIDNDRDAWKRGFDESSASGLTCTTCGSLVARMPEWVEKHRAWHEKLGQ